MKNNMLKELQEYHYCLKDVSGHWRKNPISYLHNWRTSGENLDTLKKILTIILDSDFVSVETKIFIASKGMSIKEINRFVNDARAIKLSKSGNILKPLSYNNTCLKLSEDDKELSKYLSSELLRSIAKNEVKDKNDTNKRLVKFKERYAENYNYRDNLALTIRQTTPQVTSYMGNEEFFDILQSLEAYLVQRRDIIQQVINSNVEFVDYFNYLLSKQAIDNDLVATDRERLLKFLKNEDYMTGYLDSNNSEEEPVRFLDSNIRELRPEDIKVTDSSDIQLDNYTALDYDMPMNKI